jgi:hypothetical protein
LLAAAAEAKASRAGSDSPRLAASPAEAAAHNALAHVFVGRMRRLNRSRQLLEGAGAVPVAACAPGSPEESASLHCRRCQQSVYLASAVLDAAGPPPAWRHLCLECAVEERQGAAGQAAAAATDREAGAGEALLFVKPCWEEAERCCRQLEETVQEPEGGRAAEWGRTAGCRRCTLALTWLRLSRPSSLMF